MIVLHRFVEVIRPLIFERKDIEEHRFLAVDDFFGVKGEFCLSFIEHKSAITEGDCCSGHKMLGIRSLI
jgi:hypothetical protein